MLRGFNKGMRMSAPLAPPACVGFGTETVGVKVSVVGVHTDVSRVQVVCERTYASLATQAGACVGPVDGDTVKGSVGEPGSLPAGAGVLGWGTNRGVAGGGGTPLGGSRPTEGTVRAQALLIHNVNCRRGVGSLLSVAWRLWVGECSVREVRWLLGVGRYWGKRLSSVVVYLDHPVEIRGHSVWFGGALHPVEHYVFGR